MSSFRNIILASSQRRSHYLQNLTRAAVICHHNKAFTSGRILSTDRTPLHHQGASQPYKIENTKGLFNSDPTVQSAALQEIGRTDEPLIEDGQKLQNLLIDLGLSTSKWRIYDNIHRCNKSSAAASMTSKRRRIRNRRHVNEREPPKLDHDDVLNIGDDVRMRVQSVHAARTINLMAVLTKVFGGSEVGTSQSQHQIPSRHVLGRTSVIVQLPPPLVPTDSSSVSKFAHSRAQPRFVAIFRFGSVVFFNVSSKEANTFLKQIKNHGIDPILKGFERKENFEVVIRPSLEETAHVNGDFATVKDLNMNSVAVISTIMAQTVVLDSYNDTVDELLATFASINSIVKQTGNFTDMERESLFKVVAQNNSLFIDMISKLGIKDRSDTAWNLSQYERVHIGMKEEFEIDSRFEHIEFKLNLIQQNAKFFLEILQSQKSNTLEWIIIVLISFECVLMILEMSGMGSTILGTPLFETFQLEHKPK